MFALSHTANARVGEKGDFFCLRVIPTRHHDYAPSGEENMEGKPLFLRVRNLMDDLGGARRVADALRLAPATVYKYGQDPCVSGKDIPVSHLLSLVALGAGDRANEPRQMKVDDVLGVFAETTGRLVLRKAVVTDVLALLQGDSRGLLGKPPAVCNCGSALKPSGDLRGVFICEPCSARAL